jgi:hypothetical protein
MLLSCRVFGSAEFCASLARDSLPTTGRRPLKLTLFPRHVRTVSLAAGAAGATASPTVRPA